jgi:hypothetical protein
MHLGQVYIESRSTFRIPTSHEDIEFEIRQIQTEADPLMQLISEEVLQKRIKRVVNLTFESLVAVQQIKPRFGINSLADAALFVIQEKDEKKTDKSKIFPMVIAELNNSKIGRETLLRILHAISAIFTVPVTEQPSFAKQNSRSEVLEAALFLGAQQCSAELENEKAYVCSRLCAQVAKSLMQRAVETQTSEHL